MVPTHEMQRSRLSTSQIQRWMHIFLIRCLRPVPAGRSGKPGRSFSRLRETELFALSECAITFPYRLVRSADGSSPVNRLARESEGSRFRKTWNSTYRGHKASRYTHAVPHESANRAGGCRCICVFHKPKKGNETPVAPAKRAGSLHGGASTASLRSGRPLSLRACTSPDECTLSKYMSDIVASVTKKVRNEKRSPRDGEVVSLRETCHV